MRNYSIAFVAATTLIIGSAAVAEERRCNAKIYWETTGGSVDGVLDSFTGVGFCTPTTPNRCRKRARAAIKTCAQTQYQQRWFHYPTDAAGAPTPSYRREPPEACLPAAGIEDYSMRKYCEKHRTDDSRVCNNLSGLRENSGLPANKFREVSKPGNIKHALEASVCCLEGYGITPVDGAKDYPDPKKVHVRIMAISSNSSGSRHCRMKTQLEDNYEIDCTKVRETLCKW